MRADDIAAAHGRLLPLSNSKEMVFFKFIISKLALPSDVADETKN